MRRLAWKGIDRRNGSDPSVEAINVECDVPHV